MRRLLLLCLVLLTGCFKQYMDLVPFPCPQDQLCPDPLQCIAGQCVKPQECNVLQSGGCTEAALPRCTLVRSLKGVGSFCVPSPGKSGQEGDDCKLKETGCDDQGGALCSTPVGGTPRSFPQEDSTCSDGLICQNLEMADSSLLPTKCRKYCGKDEDCGAGSACVSVTQILQSKYGDPGYQVGVCYPTCDLTSTDNSCPEGMGCSVVQDVDTTHGVGACTHVGTLTEDQFCYDYHSCGPGLSCVLDPTLPVPQNFCHKLCTSNADCPSNRRCVTTGTQLPGGLGTCAGQMF